MVLYGLSNDMPGLWSMQKLALLQSVAVGVVVAHWSWLTC